MGSGEIDQSQPHFHFTDFLETSQRTFENHFRSSGQSCVGRGDGAPVRPAGLSEIGWSNDGSADDSAGAIRLPPILCT